MRTVPPKAAALIGSVVRFYDEASQAHVALVTRVYPERHDLVDVHVFFQDGRDERVLRVPESKDPGPLCWRPMP